MQFNITPVSTGYLHNYFVKLMFINDIECSIYLSKNIQCNLNIRKITPLYNNFKIIETYIVQF